MKEIINNIKNKRYKEAFSQFDKSFQFLKDEFEIETYENPNKGLFEFIIYAGENSRRADIIYFCSMILATSLNYFKDAYKYSYDFAIKLTEIEPYNLENWEWLLFFADIPDKVMNKKTLKNSIVNILKLDDSNKKALDILNSKFTNSEKSIILSKL